MIIETKKNCNRTVFIVGTLFNLLLVLQIKKTVLPYRESDLVLFDGSPGLREIYENKTDELKKYFYNIYFSESRKISKKMRIISMVRPGDSYCKLLGIKYVPLYSDIYFWNPEETFYYLYMEYNRIGHSYKLHVYSDAISGWFLRSPDEDMPGGYKMYGRFSNYLEKFLYTKYRYDQIYNMDYDYYMFLPEKSFVKHNHMLQAVSLIDKEDSEFVFFINAIFSFDRNYKIKEKYILLDAASDRWGDLQTHNRLIKEFSSVVGHDNFIIKPHPRTDKKFYEGCDVNIEEKVYPWDIYCINHDISNKVLLIYDGASGFIPLLLYGQTPLLISVRNCIGEIKGGYTDDMWKHLEGLVKSNIIELKNIDLKSIKDMITKIDNMKI